MATVNDILAAKGDSVYTIDEHATVLDATVRMNEHKIGGLVVTNAQGRVDGIFTERDVLRRVVAERKDPAETPVAQVMTRQVICCRTDTGLDDVQTLMRNQRIRHLPVVDAEGKLAGMISIGDVNAHFANRHEVQVQYLSEYIYGRV